MEKPATLRRVPPSERQERTDNGTHVIYDVGGWRPIMAEQI